MAEESRSLGEFAGLGGRALARVYGTPVPGKTYTVAMSVTSAVLGTDLPADTHVRVYSSVDCFIRLGIDGDTIATITSDMPLAAKTAQVIKLSRDDDNKPYVRIAGIVTASTGTLYITLLQGS